MKAILTVKQEKYVQGLFTGMSQREAYKAAYDCTRMTDKTIDERACVAAKDSKLVTRLKELTDELKERNMVTVEKVLAELSNIAFDNISNYLDYRTEKTVVGHDDNGSPITDYRTIVDLKDSRTIDTRNIKSVSIGQNGVFKFEQYCKDNALVQIGKHLGMFTENINMKSNNVNTNYNISSDVDLFKQKATPEEYANCDKLTGADIKAIMSR